MSVIIRMLDALDRIDNKKCAIEREIEEQTWLLQQELKDVKKDISNRKKEIKDKAKYIPFDNRRTFKGNGKQLIAVKGSMDSKKLIALAKKLGASEEDIEQCRRDMYWSIKDSVPGR